MKLKELKHDHSLTELLKVLIFSILMLLPFFAVGTTSLYVICNKNAYQSYYGETINEEVFTKDYLTQQNKEYNFQNTLTTFNYDSFITYQINIGNLKLNYNDIDFTNANNLYFVGSNTTSILQIRYNTTQLANINLNVYSLNFYFTYLSKQDSNSLFDNFKNNFNLVSYNKDSYLDNVFYYSFDKLQESDLFNWTQNTAIYTGVKTMTDNLEITTPVIAILIVYWFILTIIYVIIDIVLKCFTTLTHMLSQKS